jgi:hypothetical protein
MTDSEPQAKKKMSSSLAQLKNFTTVVADTGDFEGNSRHCCVIYLCNSCRAKLHNLTGCPRARNFKLFLESTIYVTEDFGNFKAMTIQNKIHTDDRSRRFVVLTLPMYLPCFSRSFVSQHLLHSL